jgi:hypothetical protein
MIRLERLADDGELSSGIVMAGGRLVVVDFI